MSAEDYAEDVERLAAVVRSLIGDAPTEERPFDVREVQLDIGLPTSDVRTVVAVSQALQLALDAAAAAVLHAGQYPSIEPDVGLRLISSADGPWHGLFGVEARTDLGRGNLRLILRGALDALNAIPEGGALAVPLRIALDAFLPGIGGDSRHREAQSVPVRTVDTSVLAGLYLRVDAILPTAVVAEPEPEPQSDELHALVARVEWLETWVKQYEDSATTRKRQTRFAALRARAPRAELSKD